MFNTIFGLPMHPLVVHATVVVVPTAAVCVALSALWPRFRAWANYLPLGLSLLALILVPVSTSSGESLEHNLPHTALIERHADLAEGLLVWVIVVAVAAALMLAYDRFGQNDDKSPAPRWIATGIIAISLVSSIGTGVQVGRIGHSGAQAAWTGVK
ncbi:MAG: DUF2231 domain-containing protein [Aeromicrobium sp.]